METSRQAVEKNLSEIAFASLAEKTPALMDFYLGFDLVEKNDEGTRAAGIMGFKVGKQLVYVPIFFLNGKIKGTEVMYLKNSDIFVNNSEQWVNYVIGQSQGDTGEAKTPDKNHPEAGEVAKALALFSRPPASATKTASIEDYSLSTVEDFIDKDLLNEPLKMSLVDFIQKMGADQFQKIAEVLTQEKVWKCVTQIYDPAELMVKFDETKQASEEKVTEDKSVRLIRVEGAMDEKVASILTPEEKALVFTEGYIIKNAVEGDEATKTYIEDEKDSFQEVTESGLYNVLNKAGELIEAFVFVGPVSIDAVNTSRGGSTGRLIIAKSSKNFVSTRDEVFYRTVREAKKVTDKSDKDLLTDGAKGFDSLSVDKTYLLVGEDFSVYGPFEVKNKTREGGRTTVTVRQSYGCCCCGGSYQTVNLRSIKLDKAKIDRAGDTIYVPDSYKFIEVKESGYYLEDDEVDVRPGSFATVVDALSSKGGLKAIFEKSNNDLVASVEDKTASFTNRGDFVFYLCDTMRLPLVISEKIASKLIDGGRPFQAIFMPKTAAGAFPDVIDPNTAYGATRDGTPMETEGTYNQQMVPPNPPQIPATDPSFGSWDQPSKEDMSLLERASNSNSREVFDPAMIGILVRTTRAESIVQEYIPEFVDNLDRMIRLLLLFYWHNAEFADSYGIDEMADFEDLLLSTIKTTGKTILFLKQKSVESSTGATDVLG